jgi:hypothetical protein
MELLQTDIHRLENIMTLDYGLYRGFNSLKVWLEPTVSTKILAYHPTIDH